MFVQINGISSESNKDPGKILKYFTKNCIKFVYKEVLKCFVWESAVDYV